jgi:hypothetical protein
MALFGRRKSARCGLLTAVISAGTGDQNGQWDVIWIGDGHGCQEPPELRAASLSGAADQAAASALALYAAGELAPDAELQFAIYPWDYGKDAPIYDITLTGGEFRAEDLLDDSSQPISAPSLEDLIAALGQQPGGGAAMLRWGRPFAEL